MIKNRITCFIFNELKW